MGRPSLAEQRTEEILDAFENRLDGAIVALVTRDRNRPPSQRFHLCSGFAQRARHRALVTSYRSSNHVHCGARRSKLERTALANAPAPASHKGDFSFQI